MRRELSFSLACCLLAVGGGRAAAATPTSAVDRPRLLFTPADVPALRAKVLDGGDDDLAFAAILSRWPSYESTPNESLLTGAMAGSNVVSELGLMAHIEHPGNPPAQRARQLVLNVARAWDVDADEFRSALRLRTLALGYDMVFEGRPPAEQAEIRSEIQSYLAFMPGHVNYYRYAYNPYTSNKGMTVGASMGLAAIAIWQDVSPPEQAALVAALEFADLLVGKCLDDLLTRDGAYREGVLYGAWTMRMGIPYFEARLRFDGVDLIANRNVERMAQWLAYEVLPEGGGRTNNLNDSPWVSHPLGVNSTYLDWAQTRWASTLARWLYRHVAGEFGWNDDVDADRTATVLWAQPLPDVDPGTWLPTGWLFAQRGVYFHRSAWKSGATGDEILFSLHAGRFLGGHAQEDQGQFTLYAYGDRYALDNGAAYPTSTPKETQSHNLVLIDGQGQHNAGSSIGTDAQIASALTAPFCDYVRADLESAYDRHSSYNDPGVPFPSTNWSWGYDGGNPVARANRSVAVVHGAEAPTWVFLADDIQKDATPRTYEWLLHTDATNTIDVVADRATVQGATSRMLVWFAHPRAPSLQLAAAPYANGGEDPSTLRLVATVQAVEPRYVVALIPLPDGSPSPSATISQLGRATRLTLGWSAVSDLAVFNPTDSMCGGDLQTDGRMSVVRVAGTQVVRYMLAEGSMLSYLGLHLLVLSGGEGNVTLSGTTLQLSRSDLGFVAYGPAIEHVIGPIGELAFVRDGPWVHNATVTGVGETPGGSRASVGHRQHAIPIECALPRLGSLHANIYDVRGRLLRSLGSGALDAAGQALLWDGRDGRDRRAAAGVYLVHVRACDRNAVRRIVLLP